MDTGALVDQYWNNLQNQSLLFPPNKEAYRGQCVQPVMFYMRDYLHVTVRWRGTAAEYGYTGDGLNWVLNNPSDPNQIPPKGAIIVWAANLPGSGDSGHIAVFWGNNPGAHTFVSIDSNWGGKTLHMVTHNWQYVAGWLVPNAPAVVTASATISTPQTQGDEMISNENQAHQVYKAVRPNGDADAGEIAQTVGKRTYAQFFNDAQPEVNNRDAAIRDTNAQLASARDTINQLNTVITDLNANGVQTKQQLDSALGKISSLTADLTTANDKIVDYQKQIANPLALAVAQAQNAPAPTKNIKAPWFVQILAAVMFRKK